MGDRTGRHAARSLTLLWENFGPAHLDRLAAVRAALGGEARVTGLQYRSRSDTYAWEPAAPAADLVTLFEAGREPRLAGRILALLRACRRLGRGDYFLCHYHWPEVAVAAFYLRLSGSRVFAMFDSKFDDKPRRLWRECGKAVLLMPYHGAVAGSPRSEAYLRLLGLGRRPIAGHYDTISIDRIRRLAGVRPAPEGMPHAERDFVAVARLVPKKNHAMLLAAYARYRTLVRRPRRLHLCGDGPERARLEALAAALGVRADVTFHGFVPAEGVAQRLGRSLALLLPSTEEQFGQVVLEAQAMGLPAIVSDAVGARDRHLLSGVNGFVVEPGNAEGLARCMAMLCEDEALWRRMAEAARAQAPLGDVSGFVDSVGALTGLGLSSAG